VLVPASAFDSLRAVAPDRMPPFVVDDVVASGVPERHLALGDPGVTHDRDTARADLPPYVGPVDPPAGHVHEWGAQVADQADDAPLEGPSLAPYAPAGAESEGS
jgi:hypothetical protein